MTVLRGFEKPTGFHDLPPQLVRKKRRIEDRVRMVFENWGYEEVLTPALEFAETVGKASAISEQKMFKCIDRQGNTLVLRPDLTAPIARMTASVLKNEPLPLRLSYHASVFRAQENEAGRNAEFYQSGVELIGNASSTADAEVIALAVEALQNCQIDSFQLAIGHEALLDGLLRECIRNESSIQKLKEQLSQRNMVGFWEALQELDINYQAKKELLYLFQLRSCKEQLTSVRKLSETTQVLKAADQLEEVWRQLEVYGIDHYCVLDFGLIGRIGYYTGVYFEGYSSSLGFPLLSGGRYDSLLTCFHRNLPATGFALDVNRMMEVSQLECEKRERFVICYTDHLYEKAIKKAVALRKQGKVVVLDQISKPSETSKETILSDSHVIWIV
ncbi:ATP phosphoribosyltransferase regulatory subunit [Thermoflavimicrobium daqui]|nr:ATP phosphoribosyltransferase regulatory subunit [Thermoflavimicrobium daqui]